MPRSRGNLRSLACNLTTGDLHRRLACGSAIVALALGASLLSAAPARSQDGQIINPGSMAVTGFSGTIIFCVVCHGWSRNRRLVSVSHVPVHPVSPSDATANPAMKGIRNTGASGGQWTEYRERPAP